MVARDGCDNGMLLFAANINGLQVFTEFDDETETPILLSTVHDSGEAGEVGARSP